MGDKASYNRYKKRMKQVRTEAYYKEQEKLGKILLKKTYAGKVLKNNGYKIYNINEANETFRRVMKLDEITEIPGIYFVTEKDESGKVQLVEKIKKITKDNYWNGFYYPIWKNLNDSEKIKCLEWMFEKENKSKQLGIKKISYFPEEEEYVGYANGYYMGHKDTLYLSLDSLDKSYSNVFIPHVLAHELMHARQKQYVKDYSLGDSADFYTLSQTRFGHTDENELIVDYKLDYATQYALYRVNLSEKAAELHGLKMVKKFIEMNQKEFGVDVKNLKDFLYFKNMFLFQKTKRLKDSEKFDSTNGILTNEDVVLNGQSENLLKLMMLREYYQFENETFKNAKKVADMEIDKANKQYSRGEITYDELMKKLEEYLSDTERYKSYLSENEEKLSMIKATFFETLKEGKLSTSFDEKEEFKPLHLIDEEAKEFSLPKWLKTDEIRNHETNKDLKKL